MSKTLNIGSTEQTDLHITGDVRVKGSWTPACVTQSSLVLGQPQSTTFASKTVNASTTATISNSIKVNAGCSFILWKLNITSSGGEGTAKNRTQHHFAKCSNDGSTATFGGSSATSVTRIGYSGASNTYDCYDYLKGSWIANETSPYNLTLSYKGDYKMVITGWAYSFRLG